MDKFTEHLKNQIDYTWELLTNELSTDENVDYRRGFIAGKLCALLETRGDVLSELLQDIRKE